MTPVDLDAPAPKTRKTPVDYNSKTLALVRSWGYTVGKVETYNVYSGKKSDYLGIIDYIGIRDEDTLGIQACGADFAPHVAKLNGERREAVEAWLRCPSRRLAIIGWRKLKDRKYHPRVMWIELDAE